MEDLISVGNKTIYVILLLSAAPVAAATIVGLIVGLFQTVTQLQEQTLPYGIKLLTVALTIVVLMGWFGSTMMEFASFALAKALVT